MGSAESSDSHSKTTQTTADLSGLKAITATSVAAANTSSAVGSPSAASGSGWGGKPTFANVSLQIQFPTYVYACV